MDGGGALELRRGSDWEWEAAGRWVRVGLEGMGVWGRSESGFESPVCCTREAEAEGSLQLQYQLSLDSETLLLPRHPSFEKSQQNNSDLEISHPRQDFQPHPVC